VAPCMPRPREPPTIGLTISTEVRVGVATDFGVRASCPFGWSKPPREATFVCVVCFSCLRFSNLDLRDETALIGVASGAAVSLSAIVQVFECVTAKSVEMMCKARTLSRTEVLNPCKCRPTLGLLPFESCLDGEVLFRGPSDRLSGCCAA